MSEGLRGGEPLSAKRVDDNHGMIVDGLRAVGASVRSTAMVGQGFGDLAVGWRGVNYLFEVKNPNQPPSKRKLTSAEEVFHREWKGQVCIIETLEDALRTIGAINR